MARHLLFLESQTLCLWRWQQGTLTALARHPASEAGLAALGDWLAAHPGLELKLLVNPAEEEFRVETLPCLWGRERQAVLERKRSQHFFDTPYTLTCALGRHAAQREEERFLFAALPRQPLLEKLLNTLERTQTALDGLYSIPLMTGSLCRALRLPLQRSLVFSAHSDGLRESFIMNGQAVFSRLAPLSGRAVEDWRGHVLEEAQKLRRHLAHQRLIEADDVLSVCVLMDARNLTDMTNAEVEAEAKGLCFMPVDLKVAAARLGYKAKTPEEGADFLFLHLVASNPPKLQFAPARLRDARLIARARQGFVATGIVILCAGLLWGGIEWNTARRLQADSEDMQAETARQQRALEEARKTWAQDFLSLEDLRRLLVDQARFLPESPCLRAQELGRVLDGHSEAVLEKLHWRCGTERSLTVEGQFFVEDPGQLARRFEQLRLDLQGQGLRVDVLTHPAHIAPDQTLQGGDQGEMTPSGAAFRLQLFWEEKS
jgi:hypothetical protein